MFILKAYPSSRGGHPTIDYIQCYKSFFFSLTVVISIIILFFTNIMKKVTNIKCPSVDLERQQKS